MVHLKFLVCLILLGLYPCSTNAVTCDNLRSNILALADSQVGIQESKENWGPKVSEYIDSCGFKVPVPWCACFVTWVYKCLGISVPNAPAWSPSWLTRRYKDKRDALPGDVGSLWYDNLNRVGHTVLIKSKDSKGIITTEGNTNHQGSRDGDRVMHKIRPWETIYATSNWIGDQKHTVKTGENLYRIALKYGTTVDTLIKLNNIQNNHIQVGQQLIISC